MTVEEQMALWRRQDEELEVQLRELEEREILYYARFREVFRNEPTLLVWLDGPLRWKGTDPAAAGGTGGEEAAAGRRPVADLRRGHAVGGD